MILHINNVLSHQTKTHSSPYLWWRSRREGELWLILLNIFSSLLLFNPNLPRKIPTCRSWEVPRLDLTFLLGASDLVCAWTCEISWLPLIRDSLIYSDLTLCTGQGSISLISLTQTDTRHATPFLLVFPPSRYQDKAVVSLNPYPPVTEQLIWTRKIVKPLKYWIIFTEKLFPTRGLTKYKD